MPTTYPSPSKVYDQIVIANSTRRAYETCWRSFAQWCISHGRKPLPAAPSTIAAYLNDLAIRGHKAATIAKHRAAIAVAHRMQEQQPTASGIVRNEWARIRRTIGVAQHGKHPLLINDIRRICEVLPDNLNGMRDRAIILLGFASASRRSELAALNVEDLEFVPEGLILTINRSKTDQEAAGEQKGIPYGKRKSTCPVRAVKDWLSASSIISGPLFRAIGADERLGRRLRGEEIAQVVKTAAQLLGYNPKHYAGHSLRRGFVTSGARQRIPLLDLQRQTKHRSERMLRRYIEEGSLFIDNPAAQVGL